MDNFSIERDEDGIAIVSFDVPGRSINTITAAVQQDLDTLTARIIRDDAIRGVVFRSGKPSGFCAGADLAEMLGRIDGWRAAEGPEAIRAGVESAAGYSRRLRALERCGKPLAVAVEGLALGGGFEFVLACHYRVAAADAAIALSLPETGIGLMPGAGATQRLPRIIGITAALPHLLDGKPLALADALAAGVIHATAPAGSVVDAARRWILDGGSPVAPWDEKGFKLPGGGPHGPAGMGFSMAVAARHAAAGDRYPAIGNVLRSVYEGSQVPIDAGLRIESRYFFNTARSPQSKAMVRTFFTARQALSRLAEREDIAPCIVRIQDAARAEVEALAAEGVHPNILRAAAADAGVADHGPMGVGAAADALPTDSAAIERRLLYAQVIAAAACVDAGVARDPREIDAAAIRAGFPRWTGGPLSLIDVEGPATFVKQADRLAAAHPGRFIVPALLRAAAQRGAGLYD